MLVVLVPFLTLAFSPIDFSYCKGMPKDCKGCPMMEKVSAGAAQVFSLRLPCCGSYHWAGLTSSNPIIQKADNFLKGSSSVTLQTGTPFDVIPSSPGAFERNEYSFYSYTPPPSFLLKQSFLI